MAQSYESQDHQKTGESANYAHLIAPFFPLFDSGALNHQNSPLFSRDIWRSISKKDLTTTLNRTLVYGGLIGTKIRSRFDNT